MGSRRRVALIALTLSVAVACGKDGLIDLLPASPDASDRDGGAASDGGFADDASSDSAADVQAPDSAACDGGACSCGLTSCAGACVDTLRDPNHCGGCSTLLSHYQYCDQGTPTCLPGFAPCASSCVDFATNPDHCGGCGAAPCASGEKCESGSCGVGACGAGLTGCPVAGNRIACVDLTKGWPYCGNCTTVCGPDQVCAGGHCQPYAPATPCTTCPCATDCARTEGTPAACCEGFPGSSTQPICVHGSVCP